MNEWMNEWKEKKKSRKHEMVKCYKMKKKSWQKNFMYNELKFFFSVRAYVRVCVRERGSKKKKIFI